MIYVYKKFGAAGDASGIGYVTNLFLRTFPDARVISHPHEISELSDDDVLFFPRIFVVSSGRVEPEANYLCCTSAKVVQSVFWDVEAVPRLLAVSLGRADLIHAPSRFVAKLFRPHPNIEVFPLPVKELPRRAAHPKRKIIGAVLSSIHGRKNITGYIQLAQMLPDWRFHFVVVTNWRDFQPNAQHVEKLAAQPNVSLFTNLSEDELIDFYHSLDWFVVLSGGEAFCLPAWEALKCGVPVIAPKNSVFTEIQAQGLFLVNTEIAPSAESPDAAGLPLQLPKLSEVARIIEETPPVEPDRVWVQTVSFAEWRQFWNEQLEKLRRRAVLLREVPALFALHNNNFTVGLNDVSVRWARKTGSSTFCLYDALPSGVQCPIIIPYSSGYSDFSPGSEVSPFVVALMVLRNRNPSAPIVLWVHNSITPTMHGALLPIVDLFCGTSPTMLHYIPYIQDFLPQPIGNPPSENAQEGDYFIAWGVNYTALVWYEVFFKYFSYPVVLQFSFSAELPEAAYHYLARFEKNKRVKLVCGAPLELDELEKLIDAAKGYLCIDFHYSPIPTGETSARIPHVLRKGKPIIANDSARNLEWGGYVKLLKFNQRLIDGDEGAVASIASYIERNLGDFVPKSVPSVEEELKHFERVLHKAKRVRAAKTLTQ